MRGEGPCDAGGVDRGGCEPSGSVEGAFECDERLPSARLRRLTFARPHPHPSSTLPTAARSRIGHTRSRPSVLHCSASPSQISMPMDPALSLLFRRSSTIGSRNRAALALVAESGPVAPCSAYRAAQSARPPAQLGCIASCPASSGAESARPCAESGCVASCSAFRAGVSARPGAQSGSASRTPKCTQP